MGEQCTSAAARNCLRMGACARGSQTTSRNSGAKQRLQVAAGNESTSAMKRKRVAANRRRASLVRAMLAIAGGNGAVTVAVRRRAKYRAAAPLSYGSYAPPTSVRRKHAGVPAQPSGFPHHAIFQSVVLARSWLMGWYRQRWRVRLSRMQWQCFAGRRLASTGYWHCGGCRRGLGAL
jgi:hypothetical protein